MPVQDAGVEDDDLFADNDDDDEDDVTENAADIEDIPRDPEATAVTVSTVRPTENTIREEEGDTPKVITHSIFTCGEASRSRDGDFMVLFLLLVEKVQNYEMGASFLGK